MYKKQVSATAKITKEEKDEFKAKLYIFLQKKLKESLHKAVTIK